MLVGAVLFTALPEVLRLTPTWRLVIYGGLLLLVVIRSPGGLESLLSRARGRALMPLLEVRGLVKRFLGVTAVDQVDLAVEPGELVSLIGPNGSGKTTLFNCVTGYLAADGGRVLFRGHDLTSAPPHRVARLGVARTFQQVSVFPRLSALENLLVFLQQHQEEQLLARLLRTPRVRRLEAAAVDRARAAARPGRPGGEGRCGRRTASPTDSASSWPSPGR